MGGGGGKLRGTLQKNPDFLFEGGAGADLSIRGGRGRVVKKWWGGGGGGGLN